MIAHKVLSLLYITIENPTDNLVGELLTVGVRISMVFVYCSCLNFQVPDIPQQQTEKGVLIKLQYDNILRSFIWKEFIGITHFSVWYFSSVSNKNQTLINRSFIFFQTGVANLHIYATSFTLTR